MVSQHGESNSRMSVKFERLWFVHLPKWHGNLRLLLSWIFRTSRIFRSVRHEKHMHDNEHSISHEFHSKRAICPLLQPFLQLYSVYWRTLSFLSLLMGLLTLQIYKPFRLDLSLTSLKWAKNDGILIDYNRFIKMEITNWYHRICIKVPQHFLIKVWNIYLRYHLIELKSLCKVATNATFC